MRDIMLLLRQPRQDPIKNFLHLLSHHTAGIFHLPQHHRTSLIVLVATVATD
jgi:hypothetical protein